MKKIILIICIAIIALLSYQVLKNSFTKDESKNDTEIINQEEEEKIIKVNKEIEGIEIRNIKVTKQEKNQFTVEGEVENKSDETKKSRVAVLKCKNQNAENIIFAVILPELAKGELSNFSTIIFQDISEVDSIEMEV